MLEVARRRVAYAQLVEGRAEALPFEEGSFDALTFTYLLRYVEDPVATLRELVRVVRPGGTIASLEFAVPHGPWRALGAVRPRRPLRGRRRDLAGLARSNASWRRSARPLRHCRLWREAGIAHVESRRMSLGGGIVLWGKRP